MDEVMVRNEVIVYEKNKIYSVIKRILDILLALILCPIVIFIYIIVKVSYVFSGDFHPVIFKQKRTGKNGKVFTLYKFRTMVYGNDVYDLTKKDKFTKVGSLLRKTSLDELGQIINILKGEMSFIGPRPWIVEYYENMNNNQRHRCDVLPGITGLAQVKGRNNINIFDKIKYDLEYVSNMSFKQDIKIVILTIKTVISKSGAYAGKSSIQNEIECLKEQNKKAIN